MAEKIVLNGEDMSDYTFDHQVASRCGSGFSKELICHVCPASGVVSYKVNDHGLLVIDTQDFKTACEYYEQVRSWKVEV